VWRELALAHLPDLRDLILSAESHVDLWQLLQEFLSEAGVDELRRAEVKAIYEYPWWCVAMSGNDDLAAEVGTYFYENLPFYSDFEEQAPLFISMSQFPRLDSYFRYRVNDREYEDFRARCAAKHQEEP